MYFYCPASIIYRGMQSKCFTSQNVTFLSTVPDCRLSIFESGVYTARQEENDGRKYMESKSNLIDAHSERIRDKSSLTVTQKSPDLIKMSFHRKSASLNAFFFVISDAGQ